MVLLDIVGGACLVIGIGYFIMRGAHRGHFTTVLKDDIRRKGGSRPKRGEEKE